VIKHGIGGICVGLNRGAQVGVYEYVYITKYARRVCKLFLSLSLSYLPLDSIRTQTPSLLLDDSGKYVYSFPTHAWPDC
jgi:hypothetical protein